MKIWSLTMEKVFLFASYQTPLGNPNEISSVGELSPYGRSFSRYVQDIVSPVMPDIVFSLFGSAQNNTETESTILVTANITNLLTQNNSVSFTYLSTYLLSNFDVTLVDVGDLVYMGNKCWYDHFTIVLNGKLVTVVCTDAAWRTVYSNYEIVVISPISVNTFLQHYNQVKASLADLAPNAIFTAINDEKKNNQESAIVPVIHSYAPAGLTPIEVTWYCLVYGPFGNVKEALDGAITSFLESIATRDVWKALFPSLYNKRELFILPMWEKALDAVAGHEVSYGSVVKATDVIARAVSSCSHLGEEYVASVAILLPTAYKFINCIFFPTVFVNTAMFLSLISDYLPVSAMSSDFARMRLSTQQLALILYELISKAEQFSDYGTNTAPVVTRNGKRYLTSSYGDITLFVEIKTS
jgi:hypothetical protein